MLGEVELIDFVLFIFGMLVNGGASNSTPCAHHSDSSELRLYLMAEINNENHALRT